MFCLKCFVKFTRPSDSNNNNNKLLLLLIARKLTFEYDQMRVTSKIPKNYKQNAIEKKNYIHHIKTKIHHKN